MKHPTYATEEQIHAKIAALRASGETLRAIAAAIGSPITHADVERILLHVFPVGRAKRQRLHLAPVCPECYQYLPRRRPQSPAWVKQGAAILAALEETNHPKEVPHA